MDDEVAIYGNEVVNLHGKLPEAAKEVVALDMRYLLRNAGDHQGWDSLKAVIENGRYHLKARMIP